ncbi:putative Reductase [Giardia muris]|uniref:Putative Reductase n=1 Tax=Giardia muris TaxID=5742 RepID=A0A4Z1SPJ5_GIAMU|nr:putative Reductase [Giardia muris]|eukprot:TNJ27744.1 putative Reductase [Giardia muris]
MFFISVLSILGVAAFFVHRRRLDLRRRYASRYAVVTGATGGVGQALCDELIKQGFRIISISRSAGDGHTTPSVLGLSYNLDGSETTPFAERFSAFLKQHGIDQLEIGFVAHVAGYGEFCRFEETTLAHKRSLINCNLVLPIELSDYFYKGFAQRGKRGDRSAMVFISSCLALHPGPHFALYHTTKAAISALASALYIEGASLGIDILAVHPGTIRGSGFFRRPEMHMDKLPSSRRLGHTWLLSSTPADVVRVITRYLGLCCHVHTGPTAYATVLLHALVPKSLVCHVLSFPHRLTRRSSELAQ